VRHLILRGIFLMTNAELDWFYGGGAGQFWPDVWARFVAPIPEDERGDLILAYNRRLFSGDMAFETRFARIWAAWENTLASISNDGPGGESPAEYARAFARLENHYFINGGFLDGDGHILRNMGRIAEVPGTIVQGRYDMICPPVSAHRLHAVWPGSTLVTVPRAGHALSEPGISRELVRTTDALRERV
jgi:proline iminopeptidase